MHFEICRADARWAWVLFNDANETIAESDETYPSAAQAAAAALAFAHLVTRAGKSLTVAPPSGTLL